MGISKKLWIALAVPVALLAGGSAAYAAVTVIHGQGELVSQPLTGDIEVIDAQLEPLLVPGVSSDLVLTVRNRSAANVVADRVRLIQPLRDAKPTGCLTAVSGPLLSPFGVTLLDERRVVLGPGRTETVVVPSALTLAAGAKNGCGFRVLVDIQAVKAPPTTPTTTRPTTNTPTPPTDPPTSDPSSWPSVPVTTVPFPDPPTGEPSSWPPTVPTTPPTTALPLPGTEPTTFEY
ncbi:hypothetical protein BJ973_002078 [Actinoplanes tereljensis]|uniref:Uncharacterized protein n=1 Tax=Paractinoplanes tereljensis TaxID=571912 RepID=A0A919TTH5_9ACTN|nr:hypothetical protein [Actinoplanes tereljensis]GIF20017.1 hypothetical protein Ate02nite_27470 [Actinoplanes tereljensis]